MLNIQKSKIMVLILNKSIITFLNFCILILRLSASWPRGRTHEAEAKTHKAEARFFGLEA